MMTLLFICSISKELGEQQVLVKALNGTGKMHPETVKTKRRS
jgi:hypothetical protein